MVFKVRPKVPQLKRLHFAEGVRRRPPIQVPPPSWQLFELKRLCLEGLQVEWFRNPGLLRRALVHGSEANLAGKYGNNSPFRYLGKRIVDFVANKTVAEYRPRRLAEFGLFLVSRDRKCKAARQIGLQHAVHFARDERGVPSDVNVLGEAYEAVTAAIMLDRGYKTAEEFVQRTLLHDARNFISDRPDEQGSYEVVGHPHRPSKSLEREIKFWRQQCQVLHGFEPPMPRGEVLFEEIRQKGMPNQYCKARLEVLGITLSRAIRNAMLGALETLGSPYFGYEVVDWRTGQVSRLPAVHGLQLLLAMGCVMEVKDNGRIVNGKHYKDAESALRALRNRTQPPLWKDEYPEVNLDAEERRLRMFVNKDEAREIQRLIQAANERTDDPDIYRRLVVGNSIVNLFSMEEAFWNSKALEKKNIQRSYYQTLDTLQTARWLRAQRAERFGLTLRGEAGATEEVANRRLSAGLKLALSAVNDLQGYERARNLLKQLTYYDHQ